jgi:hypothetical protein
MMMRILLAAAALVALSGCNQLSGIFGGGADANEAQANNLSSGGKDPAPGNVQVSDAGITSSRSFQPPTGAPAAPDGGKVPTAGQVFDASLMIGRWGDFGDCTKNVIDFQPNGVFRTANGGEGSWALEGNRLTFSGNQGTITVTVQSLDANGLTAVQADGSVGRSQRC